MTGLPENRIEVLLQPYLAGYPAGDVPVDLFKQLAGYLELLLRWNARTNLTAIRDPEEIVRRHFGESLFAARHLSTRLPATASLLDFGSGAGFPGLPIHLLLPELQVALAESQNKKVAFLREVIRTLDLRAEIWSGRVEAMPPERRFHCVTLRAVDNMAAALVAARARLLPGGLMLSLTTAEKAEARKALVPIPNTQAGVLEFYVAG